MEVKEMIKAITGTPRLPALVCKVDSVDATRLTCDLTPADGSAPIKGALLTPLAGSGALVAVPQPGSWALAVMLSDNNAVVVMVDKAQNFVMENQAVKMKDLLMEISDIVRNLTVPTPAGASGTPLPPTLAALIQWENRVKLMFK